METKANFVAVGMFTLAAIAAIFAFVYWTAGLGDTSQSAELRIRIPGSASGLGRGSAVLFNGVKVGEVRRVYIDVSNPAVAIADTHVDPMTPITRSTRATVGIVGLTGTTNIEIKGGTSNEPNIFEEAEQNNTIAEIVAEPSVVTNILESATTFISRADAVLGELETFVRDAREPLAQTLRNAEKFSGALAENSDGIDNFLRSAGELAGTLDKVSEQLGPTLESARKLLEAVDQERVGTIISNVEGFSSKINKAAENLDGIVANVEVASKNIAEFSQQASTTLEKVDGVLAGIDSETVRTMVQDMAAASNTARTVADDVAGITSKFDQYGDDIDRIVANVSDMSARLNAASLRVDGVLAKLDGVLGSEDSQSLISDARETVKAFREVAETLNARSGTILDGLSRFSGPGLRDVEALVNDARRSITRIEQAISAFERNPQRILSGGEGEVRRYDGRARR